MKSNFSFKFFACAVLFVFLSIFAGGCGGSSSSPDTPILGDVFDEGSTATVGFTYFGEEGSATFKREGEAFVLTDKGGNFADNFSNANAWIEESNFVVQLYLENGWELGVAIASENGLPTDDVWEIVFTSDSDTYQDRLRTGVFATASEDFQVTSVVVNGVDIIDTLKPLPYVPETPVEPTPEPTEPEAPSDDSTNGGGNSGNGGGSTPAPSTIAVTSVSLNSSDISLGIGKTATLVATVLPTNATNATVTWSTTNPTVATVANGVVTGVSAGTATITATAGGKSATCTVNVGVLYLSRSYNATTQKVVTETKAAVDYELVTASTTTFADGKYYVVSEDVTIDTTSGYRINTIGTAHLILCNGATLTANKGLGLPSNGTLHIYAQSDTSAGRLVANARYSNSGIGNGDGSTGALYIHGGNIEATGANSNGAGAGIGGGSKYKGGNVYIFGGTITATGGSYNNNNGTIEAAAGIGGGGGIYGTDVGDGGNVYIYGGTVTATGGYVAPGPYSPSPKTGMGIGAGDSSTINGSLTIGAGLTVKYSTDGTNYTAYAGNDYSTRYQYMKVEPSSSSN